MEEKEKFIETPDMQKAREELEHMTHEERKAGRAAMREKLKRYYNGWRRIAVDEKLVRKDRDE